MIPVSKLMRPYGTVEPVRIGLTKHYLGGEERIGLILDHLRNGCSAFRAAPE